MPDTKRTDSGGRGVFAKGLTPDEFPAGPPSNYHKHNGMRRREAQR
jgi:hypothetical protein